VDDVEDIREVVPAREALKQQSGAIVAAAAQGGDSPVSSRGGRASPVVSVAPEQGRRLSLVLEATDHWRQLLLDMEDRNAEQRYANNVPGSTGAAVTRQLAAEALRIARSSASCYSKPMDWDGDYDAPSSRPASPAMVVPAEVSHLLRSGGSLWGIGH
jgi:hypothetical protein